MDIPQRDIFISGSNGVPPWVSPGSVVDYDFKGDRYYGPALAVSRASPAYIDDSSGNWALVPANTLRRSNKGALIEGAQTNSIRNNSMQGAAVGTPGTLPTNWGSANTSTGTMLAVVGIGTDNGVDYIDISITGTATASGVISIYFDTTTGVSAATGQLWSANLFSKIIGGSTANITEIDLALDENNSSGTAVTNGFQAIALSGAGALGASRFTYNRTLSGGATVAALRPRLRIPVTTGAINVIIRIGWPQLEQWSTAVTTVGGASSPIRTTGTAATRAADAVTANVTGMIAGPASVAVVARAPAYRVSTAAFWTLRNGDGSAFEGLRTRGAGNEFVPVLGDQVPNNAFPAGEQWVAGQRFALASAMAASDYALASNGAVVATIAGAQTPSIVGLMIGSGGSAGAYNSGYIERLAVYPYRAANSNLQQLSILANWGG